MQVDDWYIDYQSLFLFKAFESAQSHFSVSFPNLPAFQTRVRKLLSGWSTSNSCALMSLSCLRIIAVGSGDAIQINLEIT